MRRPVVAWTLVLLGLAAPLGAQSALVAGVAATLGDGWQIEAVDFGLVRPLALGPVRRWTVAARAGSFVDQAAFFGGQRGIVGALALALRTGSATVAELGNDPDVTRVSMDLTLEGAGYVAANSPLPHGSPWAAVALLPGIRVGDPGSSQFTVLLGPTAFLGHRSAVKGFLGVRLELPLARRGGVP